MSERGEKMDPDLLKITAFNLVIIAFVAWWLIRRVRSKIAEVEKRQSAQWKKMFSEDE